MNTKTRRLKRQKEFLKKCSCRIEESATGVTFYTCDYCFIPKFNGPRQVYYIANEDRIGYRKWKNIKGDE